MSRSEKSNLNYLNHLKQSKSMENLINVRDMLLCPLKNNLKLKISTFLFLVTLINTYASTYSQNTKISLNLKEVNIEQVLDEIQSLSEFNFIYDDDDVDFERIVSISVKKERISKILQRLFVNTNITFNVINKQIILKNRKEDTPPIPLKTNQPKKQQNTITGLVSDEFGQPLPGANIILEGTTKGVQTDFDGKYNIEANAGDVLVFSYVGMKNTKITVGTGTTINVILKEDAAALDEIVVTALGIKREMKSLGYAVEKVSGDDLQGSKDANFTSALSGKVAGLIISSSSGVGGSTRIILRGESSLNPNGNQPLFVVDGVPINNDVSSGNIDGKGADYGNGAGEINGDDVESVTILKGPAAAALYGSRGANGVIVITTKSGKGAGNGIGVSVSSSYTMDNVLRFPLLQNSFGVGDNGKFKGGDFEYTNGGLYPNTNDRTDESWGPRLNIGTVMTQFDSPTTTGRRGADVYLNDRGLIIPTPWVSYNGMEQFFQTGSTVKNNISVTGANDEGNFRLSFTNLDQEGIVPNNKLKRNTIAFNGGYKFTDKLSATFGLNYILTKSPNRPENGYGNQGPMYFFVWNPASTNIDSLRDYWTPGLEGRQQFNNIYAWHNNPFFQQYENTNTQDKNRIVGNLTLNYEFNDNFSVILKASIDEFNENRQSRKAFSTQGNLEGGFSNSNSYFNETNYSAMFKYDFKLESKWGAALTSGVNRRDVSIRNDRASVGSLILPEIYNIGNSASEVQSSNWVGGMRVNSVYALAQFDYDNKVYLDVTGRNDWSSTLPTDDNSYFYPSVSVSAILNRIIKLPEVINFAKIRVGWAEVGNDTSIFNLRNTLQFSTKWGNTVGLTTQSDLKNPQLKPEAIGTYEFGLDLGFFNNRLKADFTYYDIKSTNQILDIPLALSSGYNSRTINAGEIQNRGIEIMLRGTPIETESGFKWSIAASFAKNTNKVISLIDGLKTYLQPTGGAEDATVEARVGERMGALYGPGFARVVSGPLAGEMIIKANGRPEVTSEPIYLGNVNPDWTAGITNTFSYKGFYVSGLLDIRQGGVFISRFLNKGMGTGIIKESGDIRLLRDKGYEYTDRNGNTTLYYHQGAADLGNGSYSPNLLSTDGSLSEGVYGVSARDYNKRFFDHISEAQLLDASFVKLRELSFGYTVSKKILEKTPFEKIQLSVVGRNVKLWTKNPHFDPEAALANAQGGLVPGFENMSLPSTKSWSFNVKFNL